MKDTDASWLAGMWEGEGSILLYSRRTPQKGRTQITPSLEITNTDIHIMNHIRKLLESIGCSYSWQEPKTRKKHHRQAYSLRTQNAKYIKATLEAMLPHLVGEKRAKGETLLAFVTRRMEKVEQTTHKSFKHTPYDEDDHDLIDNLRSSETTR